MGLFIVALGACVGRAGKLHEEQGSVVFPGRRGMRAEGNFLAGGGGEDASLEEGGRSVAASRRIWL